MESLVGKLLMIREQKTLERRMCQAQSAAAINCKNGKERQDMARKKERQGGREERRNE